MYATTLRLSEDLVDLTKVQYTLGESQCAAFRTIEIPDYFTAAVHWRFQNRIDPWHKGETIRTIFMGLEHVVCILRYHRDSDEEAKRRATLRRLFGKTDLKVTFQVEGLKWYEEDSSV